MKLRFQFETMEMGDEICAVPVGENAEQFHGVLQLNDVSAKMLKCISESETPDEALKKLMKEYPDEPFNEVGQKLCDFLNMLIKQGLLIP